MNKTEMLEILRGKVLHESQEEIQSRLNEIADELEQSERVVHGQWVIRYIAYSDSSEDMCSNCGFGALHYGYGDHNVARTNYCPNCGARLDGGERMIDRNPCYKCGFHDEDFGCTADPKQPWTVPEECYLYDEDEVNAMIEFYKVGDER